MKRALVRWDKIIVTAAIACVLTVCYILRVPCLFNYVTGLPCLTCGMTRAWLSFVSFDVSAAFDYHPLFWTVPILYLYFWFDGVLFKKKALDLPIVFGILAAFGVHWIIVLIEYFAK